MSRAKTRFFHSLSDYASTLRLAVAATPTSVRMSSASAGLLWPIEIEYSAIPTGSNGGRGEDMCRVGQARGGWRELARRWRDRVALAEARCLNQTEIRLSILAPRGIKGGAFTSTPGPREKVLVFVESFNNGMAEAFESTDNGKPLTA